MAVEYEKDASADYVEWQDAFILVHACEIFFLLFVFEIW